MLREPCMNIFPYFIVHITVKTKSKIWEPAKFDYEEVIKQK